MFHNSELFHNSDEYFDELRNNKNREKPVVEYLPIGDFPILVDERVHIITYGHPAAYLDKAPYVITSPVVSYDKETGDMETRNTKYVLKKVDK